MTYAIGNAVQLGLMALDGYFTGGLTAEPDWEVIELRETNDAVFKFHVSGINHNCKPGDYGHMFIWSVPSLGWRFFWVQDEPKPTKPAGSSAPECSICRSRHGLKIIHACE